MRERDRLSSMQHRLELQAIEEQAREERERPIREAERKLSQTLVKLAEVEKERLIGKAHDPDMFIDPVVGSDRRFESMKHAQEFTAQQFNLYTAKHPETYVCQELLDLLDSYCAKQGIVAVTASMIEKIVQRFADCGLLPERPAPVEPVSDTPVVEQTPKEPELVDGWDLESGEPCQYTQRALNLMSSTDYRKALRLYKADLVLPNIGPGAGLQW